MLSQLLRVIQDAKVMVSVRGTGITGVHKARMLPTPGFVIVNTDDDGDNRKHGEDIGTDMKEKKETRGDENVTRNLHLVHFFLAAFSADFVTLPAVLSVLSTVLMMPTATVCLMSRTAKRPRGGYSL